VVYGAVVNTVFFGLTGYSMDLPKHQYSYIDVQSRFFNTRRVVPLVVPKQTSISRTLHGTYRRAKRNRHEALSYITFNSNKYINRVGV
jgi:hypothetical protein